MSASKALETLLVCTCSAQSALSNDINDDFVCDKVEKKSVSLLCCRTVHRTVHGVAARDGCLLVMKH